ncbi:MAG: ABC transporter permease [Candidatus Thorarchaeota archaeon]|nr:ABC transporter permease [Candidatus Thorarchaeota archaeon]
MLAIARKDMKVYYTKGPTLIFGLLFPFFFFLSFVVGRAMDPATLLPGLLAMVVFFSATAVGPVIFPIETRAHTLERLISMPVPLWCILIGDSLASATFCLFSSLIPFVLVCLLMELSFIQLGLTIVGIIIGSICFAFFGQMMSAPPVDQTSTIMMITTMVKFPLIFISGIFISLASLPEVILIIALFSPLTYLADLFWASISGASVFHPFFDIASAIGWTLFFVTVSYLAHMRTLERRL